METLTSFLIKELNNYSTSFMAALRLLLFPLFPIVALFLRSSFEVEDIFNLS